MIELKYLTLYLCCNVVQTVPQDIPCFICGSLEESLNAWDEAGNTWEGAKARKSYNSQVQKWSDGWV